MSIKIWKHEDNLALRKNIEALIAASIQDVLGGNIIHKVVSSSINHTSLQPEGDQFTINLVIQVYEKKEPSIPQQ